MTISARSRRPWRGSPAIAAAIALSAVVYGQVPAPGSPPKGLRAQLTAEERAAIGEGWALLAKGRGEDAERYALNLLARYPRSLAGAALLIEAAAAQRGGAAALQAYEAWLGSRTLESPHLLRSVGRAILIDSTQLPEVGVEALQHLAADDDVEARAELARRMVEGGLGETRALARLGDAGAVRRLIDQLETVRGSRMWQISALVESASPLAVPALTKLLGDTNFPEHMAAAADGLGTLGAAGAVPQLRRLYEDTSQLGSVRFAAAVGLYKLGDMTGLNLLEAQLASEFAHISIDTARRMALQPNAQWHATVQRHLNDADPVVRLRAAELIAPYELERARQSLEVLLLHDNPAIRQMAAQALVTTTATDFRVLRRFLASPIPQARVAAAGRILAATR